MRPTGCGRPDAADGMRSWAHGLCRTPGSCWCLRRTPTDLNERVLPEQSTCTLVFDLDEAGLLAGPIPARGCRRLGPGGGTGSAVELAVADVLCG